MSHKEALKLALEALEANQPVNYCMNNNGEKFPMMQEDPFKFERNTKAITAIKAALEAHKALSAERVAQPEQKPVAWRHKGQPWEFKTDYCINLPDVVPDSWEPLYTTPPQRPSRSDMTWVGLTPQDRDEITNTVMMDIWQVARAIEAKLKEKNT